MTTDTFRTAAELRARNRRTVERWLSTDRDDRARRHLLYTPDGSASLSFTDVGHPIVVRGRDKLRAHGEKSLQVLPDWRWYDTTIFETQDPNRFWVETSGEGTIRFPGYSEGHYRNRFLHAFELRDGEIVDGREHTNPIEHMRALGIETPVIERDWIPT